MLSVNTFTSTLKHPDIEILDGGCRRMDWFLRHPVLATAFCEALKAEADIQAKVVLAPGGYRVSLWYDDTEMDRVVFCCYLVGQMQARQLYLEACWEVADGDA